MICAGRKRENAKQVSPLRAPLRLKKILITPTKAIVTNITSAGIRSRDSIKYPAPVNRVWSSTL